MNFQCLSLHIFMNCKYFNVYGLMKDIFKNFSQGLYLQKKRTIIYNVQLKPCNFTISSKHKSKKSTKGYGQ